MGGLKSIQALRTAWQTDRCRWSPTVSPISAKALLALLNGGGDRQKSDPRPMMLPRMARRAASPPEEPADESNRLKGFTV